MRELTLSEMALVAGAGDDCGGGDDSSSDGNDNTNDYGGIVDTESVGDDIIEIYEGLVAATSHIIERVAKAF